MNKIKNTLDNIVVTIIIIMTTIFSVLFAYIIQFAYKMFGANHITISDIIALWGLCLSGLNYILFIILFCFYEKIKSLFAKKPETKERDEYIRGIYNENQI